jgi:hypothetical protein
MKYQTFRFNRAILDVKTRLKTAPIVHTEKWQGLDVRSKPEMATHELLNYSLSVDPSSHITLKELVEDIRPDLPWADHHFEERICGKPLNPPPSEAWWPHAPQGNSKFISNGVFSHTYPERYWPKYAGNTPFDGDYQSRGATPNHGIRFEYGDLNDLINMLAAVPHTRQAYLPVWFPEDLGASLDARRPCTLGYHFILRDNRFHVVYFIRSCDFVRHFRNDIYMTVRLQHWILDQLKSRESQDWLNVSPGSFTMHCTSLHLFRHDYQQVYG